MVWTAAAKAVGPRMQVSESVPFLSKPKNLDSSMPGYAGFDPFGLSEYFDVKWLQVILPYMIADQVIVY